MRGAFRVLTASLVVSVGLVLAPGRAVAGEIVPRTPPTITYETDGAQPGVGDLLLLGEGAGWAVPGGASSYQWLRDGAEIPGATGTAYELVTGDADASIAIRERYVAGGDSGASDSVPVAIRPLPLKNELAPEISGSGRVGSTVTVTRAGQWSLSTVTRTYTWLRNGEEIQGTAGERYTVRAGDLDAEIQVRERAVDPGRSAEENSNGVLGRPGQLQGLTAPWISGTSKVGATLTGVPGRTTPAADSASFGWKRDGRPITGATGRSHKLVAADAGHRVTVAVTLAKTGYAVEVSSSAARKIAALNVRKPTVKGTFRVGRRLAAGKGSWYAAGYHFSYTWLRNGKAVKSASRPTYTVGRVDRGKRVSVRVTARKPGFPTVIATSRPKSVS